MSTPQQHNGKKQEMVEKCNDCYTENRHSLYGLDAADFHLGSRRHTPAMIEVEYYLNSQMEVLKQGVSLFADKYRSGFLNGGHGK